MPFTLTGSVGPVNGNFHALKIQILNPNVAVGFAGSVQTALKLIKTLSDKLLLMPRTNVPLELHNMLQNFYASVTRSAHSDCDFLVFEKTENGPKLTKLTRGGVVSCRRAYIGDALKYNELMTLRIRPNLGFSHLVQSPDGSPEVVPASLSAEQIEFIEMTNAMEALVRKYPNGSVSAICGSIIRVGIGIFSQELEYLQSVEVSVTPWEGHSGFTHLASNSGVRGVGIYFRSGQLGFIFVVADLEWCRKEYAATLTDFISLAGVKYGLNLDGGRWDD